MYKSELLLLILIFSAINLSAQSEEIITLDTGSGELEGTLLSPNLDKKFPLALIIAGSGPTDRDGNNPMMTNNSLKMLATGLAENGIATLRYDKRGVAKSANAGLKEIDLRFENYAEDASKWLELLRKDNRFNEIIVIGHSEGSLIGMLAANNDIVDKFVSIAGVGRLAADILREQLQGQPAVVLDASLPILDKLEAGETVEDIPPMLLSLFRPSVQPYMISWFQYNPKDEIAKLKKPVLIIQGTTDIQVKVFDAEQLAEGNSNSKLQIIDGMNHVLKEAVSDRQKNIETYSNPDLPLINGLVDAIANFIKK